MSHPTGNKKDILQKHIGAKEWIEHAKHILEMTQSEAFLLFKKTYPETVIRHDRQSCMCLDEWEEINLEREADPSRTRSTDDAGTILLSEGVADLATKDSIVAIAAVGDSQYDFYLLKILSEGTVTVLEDNLVMISRLSSYSWSACNFGTLFSA